MLTTETILQKLEENKAKIRSFGVMRLFLFGSFARDEQTKNSDIDFLVEFKEGRGLFDDSFGLLQFLEQLFPTKIDLVKKALVREELREEILGGTQLEAKV